METPPHPAETPVNPICRVTGLPDFPAMRAEDVLPGLETLVAGYRSGVESMLSSGGLPDWSFVEAEIDWSDAIERAWSPVSHLNSVADEPELRQAYNAGLALLTEHQTWRQQHRGIFEVYKALRQSAEFAQLTTAQQRIVELEIRDFHLAGVDLDETAREEYRETVLRMSALGSQFQENVLDATHAWTMQFDEPAALSGLPEAELRLLGENARVQGQKGWLVDLAYPTYEAIMTHAEDRELRRTVYTAYVTRASDKGPHAGRWDNTPVIREFLSLRHRLARLLGFADYPAYALSTRMAQRAETVAEFLDGLAVRALPAARAQFNALVEFATGQGAQIPLEPWDMSFWSERYRQAELGLSDEVLKPYFPLDAMVSALFHICGRIFGISLEQDRQVPLWHEQARFYWLHDSSGERCAGLYMDLFARQGKRGGAWMGVCQSRRLLTTGVQLPVAYLNCNFPPPAEGHPSLLTHHDLQTLFHEFGHCLHHMLTEVDWPQINGINNVEWDAVELPSQLLENWCWEEHLLDGFARHYKTGQSLPAELRSRLLRSQRFHKALTLVRQLEYAVTDLRLHLHYDADQPRDPLEVLAEVRKEYAVVSTPDWNRSLNSFIHIFGGGYSAGYYSYLWAEQLAADAWERFLEEGPFNQSTGLSLRKEIYAVGASRPAMASFTAFRGRAPQADPLLRSYGLD
ncbi:MAG TPA: M3 family metallopeptidase [Xanthomonadales bacterium]|nr:M3 family metallopeptidase [Xanthomonadales bacterium]